MRIFDFITAACRAFVCAAHLSAMEGQLACLKFIVSESRNATHVLGARNNNGETPKMLAERFYKNAVFEYINSIEWERDHPEEAESMLVSNLVMSVLIWMLCWHHMLVSSGGYSCLLTQQSPLTKGGGWLSIPYMRALQTVCFFFIKILNFGPSFVQKKRKKTWSFHEDPTRGSSADSYYRPTFHADHSLPPIFWQIFDPSELI